MKFTEWLKCDFVNCKEALEIVLNRSIPLWVFSIYYCIFALILLPLAIPAYLITKYMVKKAQQRILESLYEEA
jgi:hypothetical protein